MDEIHRVFAKAKRANVTIHAIDPGGLSGFASTVVDASARSASEAANAGQLESWRQDVLGAISASTGGSLDCAAARFRPSTTSCWPSSTCLPGGTISASRPSSGVRG